MADAPAATFGSALQLAHFSADGQAHPGEAIALHMVWQATEPLKEDLTVFAHVLDANHQLVAYMYALPLGDAYPTSRWQLGEVVATRLTLARPVGFPNGDYQLALGVYRQSDLQRLEITGAVASNNQLEGGQLSVAP